MLEEFVVEFAEEAVVSEGELVALGQSGGAHAAAEAGGVVDALGDPHYQVVRLEGLVALEALLAE